MPLFQYIGDEHAPKRTVIFGHAFIQYGKPVEILDGKVAQKLSGNSSFKLIKSDSDVENAPVIAEEEEKKSAVTKPANKIKRPSGVTFDVKEEEDLSELGAEEVEALEGTKEEKKEVVADPVKAKRGGK